MRTTWLILLGGLLLAGCTTAIRLQHPDGRIAKCGPYQAMGLPSLTTPERERQCIQDFQRQGYERISE